ncbi:MAG: CocE/NonD family hydrolase C-terminal non-catalytic domain-containing protein, partial [Acidimicrobiales bacterium]
PAAVGRDVSALIDSVLTGRPEIATDNAGAGGQPLYTNDSASSNSDGLPAVGMTGVSYGGGIEFATAAYDNRVKAMVPGWAWNNLDYSLFPGGVIKLGWDELLFGAGLAETTASHGQGDTQGLSTGTIGGTGGVQSGGFDPNIVTSEVKGAALGYPDQQTLAWFAQRSMASYGAGPGGHVPDIPTLLVQGTVDTLFNLNEAWANHDMMTAAHPGLPVKMIAFCGGHVSCPTGAAPTGAGYSDTASSSSPVAPGQSASTFTEAQTIHWFDVYLRGHDASGQPVADTLAPVTYQDQLGDFFAAPSFPTAGAPGDATYISASVSGTLVSHGVPTGVGPLGEDTAVTDGPTTAGDPGALTVPVLTAGPSGKFIVGEPHVQLNVTVTGSSTELFFRLIDKATGQVVDLQTSALRLDNLDLADGAAHPNLPPKAQTVSLDMVGVAYDLPAGDTLELQVSTSTVSFEGNRGTAAVSLNGTVAVPAL